MLLRIALFVLMAAGLAGFGAVAWISTHATPEPTPTAQAAPAPAISNVLAASRTLRPGTLLKPEDVTTTPIAQLPLPEGARLDTPEARADLLGAMVRHSVLAGEVILPSQVMRAGDRGFLAAVLGQGLRAMTVGVDAVTGSAGLIWPGDHVDLILTATLDDPTAPIGRRIAGETVLHNTRVVAIDQELMQGATSASNAINNTSAQSRTVTLEVSPEDAERIAVATRLGHLSLSVIAADTPEPPPAATPTAAVTATTAPATATATTTPATPATTSPVEVAARSPVTWGGDVAAALRSGRSDDSKVGTVRLYQGNTDGKEFRF